MSRINSFGFVQGQESKSKSKDESQPNDSVYFRHLTFQEWLAAYYLAIACINLVDKDEYIHERCAFLIEKIALKLNEKQLNKMLEFLMNAFESGIITICSDCAHALATISSQLGGKQLDNAFQCLIYRLPSYFYSLYYGTTQFIMTLKEGQLDDIFKCLVDQLSGEKKDDDVRIKCAELLEKISMKWNIID
ncbi:hypothetical protein RFI_31791 [Reticulomyxa filosa]|uniref:Uncharacterized protein n=1 Tax=Reticulomyxa filosa TaxID=46433 RepID=X6LUJ6_RETFI|nr:hypothetical protein RFI_31791 [Reticulomyxa filosa]|eukprot:ETO05608.1 hypothetical protein RFI_31791 [Reticulomyxa filosa]